MQSNDFGFGIEAEFMLVNKNTFQPLGYPHLNLQKLLQIIDSIDTSDISRIGFNQKPLHNQTSPYLIEGYTLTDSDFNPIDLLPKGIEVRTPLSNNFDECTDNLRELYARLKEQLRKYDMDATMLSYHPTLPRIAAPANYKRYDYWQWALTATTTYGPDINISVPTKFEKNIDTARINSRVNYYGPAAIALTLASPLCEGGLWTVDGQIGKSFRTFERSKWAPIFYVHEKPSLRFEFKGFEMSTCTSDYHAMFLMSLALLLDDSLDMAATDDERILDLESIAIHGTQNSVTQERAAQVLTSAGNIADLLLLPKTSLVEMWTRLRTQTLPADVIAQKFIETGAIEKTLQTLTDFNTIETQIKCEKKTLSLV